MLLDLFPVPDVPAVARPSKHRMECICKPAGRQSCQVKHAGWLKCKRLGTTHQCKCLCNSQLQRLNEEAVLRLRPRLPRLAHDVRLALAAAATATLLGRLLRRQRPRPRPGIGAARHRHGGRRRYTAASRWCRLRRPCCRCCCCLLFQAAGECLCPRASRCTLLSRQVSTRGWSLHMQRSNGGQRSSVCLEEVHRARSCAREPLRRGVDVSCTEPTRGDTRNCPGSRPGFAEHIPTICVHRGAGGWRSPRQTACRTPGP